MFVCVTVCVCDTSSLYRTSRFPSVTLQLVSYEGSVSLRGSFFMFHDSFPPEVLQGRVSLSEGERVRLAAAGVDLQFKAGAKIHP